MRQGKHKELGINVAFKIYDKEKMLEPNRRRNLKREIFLMSKMKHPALVTMYEAYESKKQVFIVEEYLSGGSLQQYLKKIKSQ